MKSKWVLVFLLGVLFMSLSNVAQARESGWTDLQKKVESGEVKLSDLFKNDFVIVRYHSSNRGDGECKGESKVKGDLAKLGKFQIITKCDGKGWDSQRKPFSQKKEFETGSLDQYKKETPSESTSVQKTFKFKKTGHIEFSIDESESFSLELKNIKGGWQISEIKYSSEDPG